MSNVIMGNKYKFYIEESNGTLYELTSFIESMMVEVPFDGCTRTTIEMISDEPMKMTVHEEMKNKWKAPEWQCSFCGRPNERKDETCKSCGAVRSFIYG